MIKTIIIYAIVGYYYPHWILVGLFALQMFADVRNHLNKNLTKLLREEEKELRACNKMLLSCVQKLTKSAGLSRSERIKTVKEVKELCE